MDETAAVSIKEIVGDISVEYKIYLKNRTVEIIETVGEVQAVEQGDYDSLPDWILKAYQTYITNLNPWLEKYSD